MEKKKYIFIDDEKDDLVDSLLHNINRHDFIELEYQPSMTFDKFVAFVQKDIGKYQGVLLDLRLDEKTNPENGEKANYTAPVVAQYLRTLATDGKITDLPIVLCSTDDRLKKLYTHDLTSHNLFDMRFLKSETDKFPTIAQELLALSNGYEKINNGLSIDQLVDTDISKLDERVFARFITGETMPAHEIAQFIMKDLLFEPGVMIDEYILAARLGIDIESSSNKWTEVKEGLFKGAKYAGVFSGGWDRWWMHLVDDIFYSLSGTYLSYINADERVKLITEKTTIKPLVAAKPLEHCRSSKFWTVCSCTKEPLDPMEGFRMAVYKEPKSWQEYRYLSPDTALERKCMDKGMSVHPMDEDRYELLKKQLEE